MKTKRIAVLLGSLRQASYSRKLAQAIIAAAPAELQMDIIEIGDLPLYNQDLEDAGAPAAWTRFRETMRGMDGVVFVTPEYNRSLPAVLKNAIDVGSRPVAESIWRKKPAAVVTLSQGAMGGFGANHHLRQALVFSDMPTLQQPEMYIGLVQTLMDESGKITNEKTAELIGRFVTALRDLLAAHEA